MSEIDYETCYGVLQLNFGVGLKEVNKQWRKLSRIHHPDRHMRDPKAYRLALEKQKQLNNARDRLKKWFESNPHSPPPKKPNSSTQNNSHSGSASSNSTHRSQTEHQSQSTNNDSQKSSGQSYRKEHQTHSDRQYWNHTNDSADGFAYAKSTTNGADTGWFVPTNLKLTPLQVWVKKVNDYCNRPSSDSATALAMALCFGAVFVPLWILTSTLGLISPELQGHCPDWLMPFLLGGSGYITTYIFRWYFAEVEIIKLQERAHYFKTERTVQNSIDYLKMTIEKQTRQNAQWKFNSRGCAQEAVLEFEEKVLPDTKRTRRIVLRFEVKDSAQGRIIGLEVRAQSPVNSFSCKKITKAVLVELKKSFQEFA